MNKLWILIVTDLVHFLFLFSKTISRMTENEQPHLQNEKAKEQIIVMIISAGNSRRLATVSHV